MSQKGRRDGQSAGYAMMTLSAVQYEGQSVQVRASVSIRLLGYAEERLALDAYWSAESIYCRQTLLSFDDACALSYL